ncbi:MAG: response regulator transcription factor [Ottowia sp.]|uniref:response regulator n=1 Tax=Ottowia sp. TaxID=1898956 RepID=UPI0039E2402D
MKILIADDHRLIVEAVAEKLAELGPGVSFVQALSVQELLDGIGADLDLAIIDLGMPGARGIDHVAQVRRLRPGLPIVVLSGHEDPAVMRAAFDAGASGFIPKAYSPEVMLSAVQLVLSGGTYVPPMMMNPPALAAPQPPLAYGGVTRSLAQLRNVLTERQFEVLSLLTEGQPNKQIGRNLGISEGTVKIHLAAIFRVLKVRNRTEAVVAVRELSNA